MTVPPFKPKVINHGPVLKLFMNLSALDQNRLETLSDKATFRPKPFEKGYYRYNYPWKRVVRYLHSREGQPWDKVLAEFVRLPWLPTEYRTQKKLRAHVEVNTFLKSNKVYFYDDRAYRNCNNNSEQSIEDYSGDIFYVHPVSKLLCFHEHTKFVYPKPAVNSIYLEDYHQILKVDGIWYDVRAVSITPLQRKHFPPRMRLIDASVASISWVNTSSANYYIYRPAIVKRQLSGKELKKYGIKNSPNRA